ncbi:hypothetical protein EIP86_003719 [Pleurotus ostreatoroseus]|nr:hypothetical protein EIP86_003719 [Pleurotus ostreatoroseus]
MLRPAPLYPFLSQPPPQKKRPTKPLPSPPAQKCPSPTRSPNVGRCRSATTSSIAAWASNVHPGTPAPYSPRRISSGFSITITRRSSSNSAGHPSGSFLNFIDTPTTANRITPSIQDFKPDLTAVGYTSIFVNIPNTPFTPPEYSQAPPPPSPKVVPSSPIKGAQRVIKRFQSLSTLRSAKRARAKAPPSPPIKNAHSPIAATQSRPQPTGAVKGKKAKVAKLRPAPLANDFALAQLIDGGSIEDHAREFARAHAKAAGAKEEDGQLVGVGDLWRDGEGGVWMDCDEAWEYAHLLGKESPQSDWVCFEDGGKATSEERPQSLSTLDSDLSPRYAMQAEFDARDDLAAFTRASDRELRKPGMSVLTIPSRSRRSAKHLRKPEFLLNVFPVPLSPKGTGPLMSPRIAAFRTATLKTKIHRRPAPLKLLPPAPASKFPTNPDLDQNRRDFLEDSFVPTAMTLSASKAQTVGLRGQPEAHCYHDQKALSHNTPRSSATNMRSVRVIGSKKGGVA